MKAILYHRAMARAIRENRKNQTRRLCKCSFSSPRSPKRLGVWWTDGVRECKCPYGVEGDLLTLLTTWTVPAKYDKCRPSELPKRVKLWSFFDGDEKPRGYGRLRPGRFMPNWLRVRMPVVVIIGIHVQRVRSISDADAVAEGIVQVRRPKYRMDGFGLPDTDQDNAHTTARYAFLNLFFNLRKRAAPGENPWVWVIHFKRLHGA